MWIIFIVGAFILFFIIFVMQQQGKHDNASVCRSRVDEEFKKLNFNKEKRIGNDIPLHEIDFFIDTINKRIAFCEYNKDNITFLDFSSILDCEIVEDDIVTRSGLGRAALGAVVAGGVGAVVGAVTAKEKKIVKSLRIKLITNDVLNAMKTIDVLAMGQFSTESSMYKRAINFATETHSTILSIIKASA